MKILIIEPCYFGVGYVETARKLGLECLVATSDPSFPDQHRYREWASRILVCSVTDELAIKRTLEEAKQLSSIGAVVAGNQFVAVAASRLASLLGLAGIAPLAAEKGVHKDLARQAYKEAGAPSLMYELASSIDDARAAARRIGYPLVIKPTSEASSKGVALARNEAELDRAYRELEQMKFGMFGFAHRAEYLLEEYADGSEFSVELAVADGRVEFAGLTEKWVTQPPYFVELGHVYPARVPDQQRRALVNAAQSAAEALGLTSGVFHIELKWTSAGARIIETNPRPGGDHITTDLVPLATGVNLFEFHLRALLSKNATVQASKAGAAAVGFVVAEHDGILESVDGWECMQKRDHVVRCGLAKRRGDTIRPPESSADRIGFIVVSGETAEQAAQRLQAKLRGITVRYAQ